MKNPTYKMKGKVWLYPSETAAWHFVSLPEPQSRQISQTFGALKRGFGSLRVMVTIGKISFLTSIFPDHKTGTYLLPLKASVRKSEGIKTGDTITFTIAIIT